MDTRLALIFPNFPLTDQLMSTSRHTNTSKSMPVLINLREEVVKQALRAKKMEITTNLRAEFGK
jgi:hypothetical protein